MWLQISTTRDLMTPALRRLALMARDPTPVMRAMGTTLLSITQGTFAPQGVQYRPKPWPPKKVRARKGAVIYEPSWLTRTTTLRKSIALETGRTWAKVYVPASVPYAPVHQFGSPDRNIPARPFFPVTPSGMLTPKAAALIKAAAKRVIDRMRGAGGRH